MKSNHFKIIAAFAALALVLSSLAVADGENAKVSPPAKIKIEKLTNLYKSVVFDHEAHGGYADSCKSCHHNPFGKPLPCADCHDDDPKNPITVEDFIHEDHWKGNACADCHQVATAEKLACSGCHKVPFDENRLHVIGYKGAIHKQCMDCHRENGLEQSCTFCHARK